MSSRRQRSISVSGRYRQVSLYRISKFGCLSRTWIFYSLMADPCYTDCNMPTFFICWISQNTESRCVLNNLYTITPNISKRCLIWHIYPTYVWFLLDKWGILWLLPWVVVVVFGASWSNKLSSVWASYQMRNIVGCACAGNAGIVFPSTDFKGNCWLAIPVCITARAWITCRDAFRDR